MANPQPGTQIHKTGVREKAELMSAAEMERSLNRLAHEIVERNNGPVDLVFVGVRRRGEPLAERLARKVSAIEHQDVPVAAMDITFYRDDLSTIGEKPLVKKS